MSSLFFAPSCPSGGKFYVCTTGPRFVGCCTFNPCNDHGCGSTDLRPASFDPLKYGMFADQTCSGNNLGLWYTCTGTTLPFMGCCKTDPCSGEAGCTYQNLIAGKLSSDSVSAADFLGATTSWLSSTATSSARSSVSRASTTPVSATSSSISVSTTSHSSFVTPASAISTPASLISTSTAALGAAQPAHHSVTGVIAGSVVGGIVFLALIICLLIWWVHRRTSASRLSHVMNRASYAEQAVKEMATENAGPLGTFSKNSPQQAGYRDPNYPSHSPQYSPNSPGPPHYTISEMETNPANALSSNPRLRDSASSYLHPFPTPHPAYPMDTGYGLPVSPITPTTPSPHYFPTPSTPHPLSNLSSNEQSLSATVETSGEQSNASAAGRAQRLASAIRGLQQEVGEPSWELSSTNSVRRGGARGVNTDVSDWPAPAPPTHNQEAPSYPPRPPTMQPPVAGI